MNRSIGYRITRNNQHVHVDRYEGQWPVSLTIYSDSPDTRDDRDHYVREVNLTEDEARDIMSLLFGALDEQAPPSISPSARALAEGLQDMAGRFDA